MGVKNKYFEAKSYYYKVLCLCILVVVDILFNSFTQFVNFGIKVDTTCHVDDIYLCSGLALFEFIIIIIMIFVLLNIFSEEGEKLATVKIWTSYYLVFYILKYFTSFLFYIGILRTSFELGKTEYYRSQAIQN